MKKILALLIIMFSANTHAGFIASTVIGGISLRDDGVLIIYTTSSRTVSPSACSTEPGAFAMNTATAAEKVQLAGILLAYASGKSIALFGTGDCLVVVRNNDITGNTDDIRYYEKIESIRLR